MADVNPLADSEIRIQRASQKFALLCIEISGWLKGDTYSTSRKLDETTGEDVIQIEHVDPMPTHWCLDACEIMHHLRSALDNAIHHLSVAHTGHVVRGSEFPIYLKEKDFNDNSPRKVGGVHPKFLPFIEKCQPFRNNKPEEAFLWGLHELANSEKHQQLPLVYVFCGFHKATIQEFGGTKVADVKYADPGPFKSGTEIVRWRVVSVADGGSVTVNLNLARDIFLDVPRPPCLARYPLSLALDLMGKEVVRAVKGLKEIHEAG